MSRGPRVVRPFRMLATAAVLALGATACSDRRDVATADSALLRDLTMAASPATTPQPTLSDTAAAAPPRETAPTPAPAPVTASRAPQPTPQRVPPREPQREPQRQPQTQPRPEPATPAVSTTGAPVPAPAAAAPAPTTAATPTTAGSADAGGGRGRRGLAAGTMLSGRTDAQICSLANRPGDRFVATLSEAIVGTDGARIPAGTPILVEMATPSAEGGFAFRAKAVQVDGTLIPIEGTVTISGDVTERRVAKGDERGKVIGGAVAGAILGRVLGGGTKGTVIGAAGGAAAGTIAAARSGVTERCLPAGSTVTVVLSAPLLLSQGVP